MAHRSLSPDMERLVSIGGRQAIRRGPLVPSETVHIVAGHEVSRSSGLSADDTIFVPLNDTDILSISLKSASPALSATFKQVLESVRLQPVSRLRITGRARRQPGRRTLRAAEENKAGPGGAEVSSLSVPGQPEASLSLCTSPLGSP